MWEGDFALDLIGIKHQNDEEDDWQDSSLRKKSERTGSSLKTINVEIPEKLAGEIEKYVKSGWFNNEAELMREALRDFISHHRLRLMEKFMEEDIEWAAKIGKSSDQWK